MHNILISRASRFFDRLEHSWEDLRTMQLISNVLVIIFSGMIALVVLERFGFIHTHFNHHSIISVPFTILLLFEILGLVFVIPQSLSNALGKQIEILSLILLRSAFKEFGEIELPLAWGESQEQIMRMITDGCGGLFIFFLLAFYYTIQRHRPITTNHEEQTKFVNHRKVIALGLLILFVSVGVVDIYNWYVKDVFVLSFNTFYTILIYSDILVVLLAIRYTSRFADIFRYSGFIFVTILIRISLVAPVYFNVLLGIAASIVAIGISFTYNYFVQKAEKQNVHSS